MNVIFFDRARAGSKLNGTVFQYCQSSSSAPRELAQQTADNAVSGGRDGFHRQGLS